MDDVFLSYSRKDREVAQTVAGELVRLGVGVSWDHDLLGGDDFRKKLSEKLANVTVVIVIWSRNSIESQWVVGEASEAREKNLLVPINIDECQPPIDFRALQSINFSGWVPGDQLPEPLLKAIAKRLGRDVSYAEDPVRLGRINRLARFAVQSWYRDVESLLFYLIGQGFACFLCNIPLVVYSAKLPTWVGNYASFSTGIIVAAIYMRPALEMRRLNIAAPLFIYASALGVPIYWASTWVYEQMTRESFLTLVSSMTLALLLVTDIARRASARN